MIGFNADEVFEVAEQIERNGERFYRKATNGAAKEMAQLLLELADMEADHQKTFHEMRKELSGKELASTVFDPHGQAVMYLRALGEGKVFDIDSDPSEKLTGAESVEDVLTTAIGLEKDSVVFYVGMKEMVPAGHGKEKIDKIISEEMGHILLLNEELASRTTQTE